MKMQKILENQQINIQRKVLLKALLCLKPEPRIRLRISKIVKVRSKEDITIRMEMRIWILIIATGEQAIRFPIDMIGTMAYEGLHIKENNCEQRTV